MKKSIVLLSVSYVLLSVFAVNSYLAAQTGTRASAAISSGWFHTFQNAPGGSGQINLPPGERYRLSERRPFMLEMLFHHVISDQSDKFRIGFRMMFFSVRQIPVVGGQSDANNTSRRTLRFSNSFFSGVFQHEIYDRGRSQLLLDFAAGVSFMNFGREGGFPPGGPSRFPDAELGVQFGVDYLFGFFQQGNVLDYVRFSPRFHFQTGNSFPFSAGFFFEVGIAIQLVDNE